MVRLSSHFSSILSLVCLFFPSSPPLILSHLYLPLQITMQYYMQSKLKVQRQQTNQAFKEVEVDLRLPSLPLNFVLHIPCYRF